jgi:hypothetical protein
MKRPVCVVLAAACGLLAGCVSEASGPDAKCEWPGDGRGALDLTDARQLRHLSRDAERAEDLAIRYADGHGRPNNAGTHTIPDYVAMTNRCMTSLFGAVAAEHHVTVEQVRESVNQYRSRSLDTAVIVTFGLLYAWFANALARRIWRRFPPGRDRAMGVLATAVIGPVLSVLGAALAQLWSFWIETLRVGYGHLVYRVDRIPWGHHIPMILTAGVAIFWISGWLSYGGAEPAGKPEMVSLDSEMSRRPARSSR